MAWLVISPWRVVLMVMALSMIGGGLEAAPKSRDTCMARVDRVLDRALGKQSAPQVRLAAAHAVILKCVTETLTDELCPTLKRRAPMDEVRACLTTAAQKPLGARPRYAALSGDAGVVWADFAQRDRPQQGCIDAMTDLLQEAATARWFCAFGDRRVTAYYYAYLKRRSGS